MKRFASHFLLLPSHKLLKLHVVEIEEGCVNRIFSLSEESECVQWMPGIFALLPKEEGDVYCKQPSLLTEGDCSLFATPLSTIQNVFANINDDLKTLRWSVYRLFPFDFENMRANKYTLVTPL